MKGKKKRVSRVLSFESAGLLEARRADSGSLCFTSPRSPSLRLSRTTETRRAIKGQVRSMSMFVRFYAMNAHNIDIERHTSRKYPKKN